MVQRGDRSAFELVYERHASAAFSLAYRVVGNRLAAEDVTQEAFLSIWRSRWRYEPHRGSLRSWVLGITRRRGIDALRRNLVRDRRRADAEGIEEREEARELTDVEAIRRDEAASLRAALETLPVEQSRVLELAYFAGFTQSEIAEMLDTPIGTIKGRMRLGLEKLRGRLEGETA